MSTYLSGFCNPDCPPESHSHCPGAYQDKACRCECHRPATYCDVPTGVLVTDAEPETDEWFAARRGGITGTDLPKILGITQYGNALSVWLDKRGELPDDVGDMEAAEWGHILEDPVARKWSRTTGALVERVGVLAHVEHSWQRASLDRLVQQYTCPDDDGPCGLEIKTRSAFKAREWRDDIPDDVLAQTAWGLIVTGLDHMHVAALIGGQRMQSYRVDRDETLERYLLDAAEPVWAAVLSGTPPEAHPDAEGVLLDLLNRVYVKRAGDRDLDPEQARKWIDQYAEGSDLEKRGKALKTEAKTALVQMIDDGEAGLIDGAPAFTYRRPDPSDVLSAKHLRSLRDDQPETYQALLDEGYITRTNPGPRFDLKETA